MFLIYIQKETEICRTVDPWAGAEYVEQLTEELAQKAWKLIEEVESYGGMTKAIEAGIPKMRIEEAAAQKQALIDSGKDAIIGVNVFKTDDEQAIDILDIDNAEVRENQIAHRASRHAITAPPFDKLPCRWCARVPPIRT